MFAPLPGVLKWKNNLAGLSFDLRKYLPMPNTQTGPKREVNKQKLVTGKKSNPVRPVVLQTYIVYLRSTIN
jgi:hypothetical protein